MTENAKLKTQKSETITPTTELHNERRVEELVSRLRSSPLYSNIIRGYF